MNYRLAFVFSYERFKNALICISSFRPSTRFRPILNFQSFRKNGAKLELLNIVFLVNLKKFEFFDLAPDSRYLLTTLTRPQSSLLSQERRLGTSQLTTALKSQVLFVFSLLSIITVTTNETETHKTDRNPPITKQNPNLLNSFK